jgi:APA family basic amino acid/polyamine antiporter
LNGFMLLQGEMPYAMAKGGVFPAFMARNSARGVPVRAHLISAVLLTVLVLTNYARSMADLFTFIAILATASSLFAYLACALAALKLQATKRIEAGVVFTLIAIGAGVYAAFALVGAGGQAFWLGLVLLATGLPLYALMRRRRPAAPAAD